MLEEILNMRPTIILKKS